jgi:hypothetical protein
MGGQDGGRQGGEEMDEGAGDLRIGPTDLGMVRIHVTSATADLPLDFDPEEAEEIGEELRAAAEAARRIAQARRDRPARR